jgi:hypothetical protein
MVDRSPRERSSVQSLVTMAQILDRYLLEVAHGKQANRSAVCEMPTSLSDPSAFAGRHLPTRAGHAAAGGNASPTAIG